MKRNSLSQVFDPESAVFFSEKFEPEAASGTVWRLADCHVDLCLGACVSTGECEDSGIHPHIKTTAED